MKVIFVTNEKMTHLFNHVQMKWETVEDVDRGVIAHFHYYTWHTINGALTDINFAKTSRYGVTEKDLGYNFDYVFVEKEISLSNLLA